MAERNMSLSDLRRNDAVAASELPPGRYPAVWGGYVVTFTIPHCGEYRCQSSIGIRTPFYKCWVQVSASGVFLIDEARDA